MAKSENNKRIVGVKPTSWAMVVGTFWSIIGLAVAIMFSLRTTVDLAESTNSLLAGLTFGVASGVVAIIVVPFVYFAFGWIIGVVQGYIMNVVVRSAGGLVMTIEDNKE
jgi:hypothetical protein